MQSIELASAKIGDITSVIDGIAFQTNILALNARWKRHVPGSKAVGSRSLREVRNGQPQRSGGERDQIPY